MELIDRDILSKEMCEKCGKKDCTGITDTEICIAQLVICSQNSVDAVPIEELIELRNKLYNEDSITFRVPADINQLIGKHVRRKENK